MGSQYRLASWKLLLSKCTIPRLVALRHSGSLAIPARACSRGDGGTVRRRYGNFLAKKELLGSNCLKKRCGESLMLKRQNQIKKNGDVAQRRGKGLARFRSREEARN